MIIFISQGRLGNQLFQYAFLRTIAQSDEEVCVFGFDDLQEVCDGVEMRGLLRKHLFGKILFYKMLKPLLSLLASIRIISSYSIMHEDIGEYRRESTDYLFKVGLLSHIKFVRLGFFQSESFFDKSKIQQLKIKDKYIKKAQEFINMAGGGLAYGTDIVAIHIRRGDYRDFKVLGKDTLLPMSYFHNQVKNLELELTNPYFVFLSDEPDFIEEEFRYLSHKAISIGNSTGTDFAMITLCSNAILSPSSFGWWGTYLMEKKGIILVPKYWLGFNSLIDMHCTPLHKSMKGIIIEGLCKK